MIVTIASTKGGVGKSTLSINLLYALKKAGHEALLIDADPQLSAYSFSQLREQLFEDRPLPILAATGDTMVKAATEASDQGQLVLIDTAGADTKLARQALAVADLILTTCEPSPLDLWALSDLMGVVRQLEISKNHRVPVALLFNRAQTNRRVKSLQDSIEFVQEGQAGRVPDFLLEEPICLRIAHQHAFREGLTIFEYEPEDANAKREIQAAADYLLSILKISETTRRI